MVWFAPVLAPLTLALVLSAPAQSIPVHPASAADERDPAVVLTSQGVFVAWAASEPGKSEVRYAHSPDLAIFSAPLSVSGPIGKSETIRPHAAAAGDRAVIVWADASRGDHDVYAAISDDGGRVFQAPVLVAGGEGGQLDPRAAVLADGSIAVVFHDTFGSTGADRGLVRRIRFTSAAPNSGFSSARAVGSVDPQVAFDLFPAISANSSTITVAWLREAHDGSTQIMRAQSLDGGATFSSGEAIDSPAERELRPKIAGELIVWDTFAGADLDVRDARGLLNETTALNQMKVDAAAFGARVLTAWVDHSRPAVRKIRYRQSLDGGGNFGSEVELGNDEATGEVNHPAIAVGENIAVIVYEDARGGSFDVRAAILR